MPDTTKSAAESSDSSGNYSGPDQPTAHASLVRVVKVLGLLLICVLFVKVVFQQVDAVLVFGRADREAQRRALLAEISRTPDSTDGLFAVVQLSPMLRDPRQRDDALTMARLILPRINNYDAFGELFDGVFSHASVKELPEIIDINRRLDYSRNSLQSTMNAMDEASKRGSSSRPSPPAQPERSRLLAKKVERLKEITLTGNRIADVLRSTSSNQSMNIDYSDANFYRVDASGASFRRATLVNTIFQATDLSGASFTDIDQFDGVDFVDTRWWRAKEISAPLLKLLKDQFYPYV